MKRLAFWGILAIASVTTLTVNSQPLLPQDAQPYSADLLARVRQAAATIPGAAPLRINYIKFAESHRPMADIIDGGSKENFVSARTVFQVLYPSGWVMIDSGMVLIKAAGHTPEHQMVYVRLDSGREYLFIGDVGWTLDNVTQSKLRQALTMRRINEYAPALMHQLRWIKDVMDREKLIVIPSHDDQLLQELAAKQLVSDLLTAR